MASRKESPESGRRIQNQQKPVLACAGVAGTYGRQCFLSAGAIKGTKSAAMPAVVAAHAPATSSPVSIRPGRSFWHGTGCSTNCLTLPRSEPLRRFLGAISRQTPHGFRLRCFCRRGAGRCVEAAPCSEFGPVALWHSRILAALAHSSTPPALRNSRAYALSAP